VGRTFEFLGGEAFSLSLAHLNAATPGISAPSRAPKSGGRAEQRMMDPATSPARDAWDADMPPREERLNLSTGQSRATFSFFSIILHAHADFPSHVNRNPQNHATALHSLTSPSAKGVPAAVTPPT